MILQSVFEIAEFLVIQSLTRRLLVLHRDKPCIIFIYINIIEQLGREIFVPCSLGCKNTRNYTVAKSINCLVMSVMSVRHDGNLFQKMTKNQ